MAQSGRWLTPDVQPIVQRGILSGMIFSRQNQTSVLLVDLRLRCPVGWLLQRGVAEAVAEVLVRLFRPVCSQFPLIVEGVLNWASISLASFLCKHHSGEALVFDDRVVRLEILLDSLMSERHVAGVGAGVDDVLHPGLLQLLLP